MKKQNNNPNYIETTEGWQRRPDAPDVQRSRVDWSEYVEPKRVEQMEGSEETAMRVLVGCEFSGRVRDAFARRGHDAWSCDILPSETPGNHIQGDVLKVLGDGWDLLIAHPPCTFLSYAGLSHWNKPGRAEKREEAMWFFMQMVNAPIEKIAVENPRGYPSKAYRKPDQLIQPFYFGHDARKLTCLWLKNLPPLWFTGYREDPKPVFVDGSGKARHFTDALTGKDRQHQRSRTFPGIAEAMAAQWGGYE